MKVLLYFESEDLIQASGIGRAFEHQKMALTSAGISYTTDPWDADYDILHINTCGANSEAIIKNARKNGKKVVYHAHSTEEDFRNSFFLSNQFAPLVKLRITNLYSRGDAIITPTPYSKSLIESYGITLPIYPISNGIELDLYQPDDEKVKAYRKYFHIQPEDKVVLGVGLPFERKGIFDFIEVAKLLPDYKFIWFGDMSMPLMALDVSALVRNHPNNVYFPGYVKGPLIQGAYQDADCFFFPSYEETEGIVVLEALASHQNVIVRDIGAFDPWLVDKQDCYKGHTNPEFAKLIQGVIEKTLPDTREGGYQVAKERSIDKVGQQLKEVYTSVLK